MNDTSNSEESGAPEIGYRPVTVSCVCQECRSVIKVKQLRFTTDSNLGIKAWSHVWCMMVSKPKSPGQLWLKGSGTSWHTACGSDGSLCPGYNNLRWDDQEFFSSSFTGISSADLIRAKKRNTTKTPTSQSRSGSVPKSCSNATSAGTPTPQVFTRRAHQRSETPGIVARRTQAVGEEVVPQPEARVKDQVSQSSDIQLTANGSSDRDLATDSSDQFASIDNGSPSREAAPSRQDKPDQEATSHDEEMSFLQQLQDEYDLIEQLYGSQAKSKQVKDASTTEDITSVPLQNKNLHEEETKQDRHITNVVGSAKEGNLSSDAVRAHLAESQQGSEPIERVDGSQAQHPTAEARVNNIKDISANSVQNIDQYTKKTKQDNHIQGRTGSADKSLDEPRPSQVAPAPTSLLKTLKKDRLASPSVPSATGSPQAGPEHASVRKSVKDSYGFCAKYLRRIARCQVCTPDEFFLTKTAPRGSDPGVCSTGSLVFGILMSDSGRGYTYIHAKCLDVELLKTIRVEWKKLGKRVKIQQFIQEFDTLEKDDQIKLFQSINKAKNCFNDEAADLLQGLKRPNESAAGDAVITKKTKTEDPTVVDASEQIPVDPPASIPTSRQTQADLNERAMLEARATPVTDNTTVAEVDMAEAHMMVPTKDGDLLEASTTLLPATVRREDQEMKTVQPDEAPQRSTQIEVDHPSAVEMAASPAAIAEVNCVSYNLSYNIGRTAYFIQPPDNGVVASNAHYIWTLHWEVPAHQGTEQSVLTVYDRLTHKHKIIALTQEQEISWGKLSVGHVQVPSSIPKLSHPHATIFTGSQGRPFMLLLGLNSAGTHDWYYIDLDQGSWSMQNPSFNIVPAVLTAPWGFGDRSFIFKVPFEAPHYMAFDFYHQEWRPSFGDEPNPRSVNFQPGPTPENAKHYRSVACHADHIFVLPSLAERGAPDGGLTLDTITHFEVRSDPKEVQRHVIDCSRGDVPKNLHSSQLFVSPTLEALIVLGTVMGSDTLRLWVCQMSAPFRQLRDGLTGIWTEIDYEQRLPRLVFARDMRIGFVDDHRITLFGQHADSRGSHSNNSSSSSTPTTSPAPATAGGVACNVKVDIELSL